MRHVEIARTLQPVLMGLDRQRPDQSQAAFTAGRDAHHVGAPLQLLVQALQHVGRLHVLVVLLRQPVVDQGVLDVRLDPVGQLGVLGRHLVSRRAAKVANSLSSHVLIWLIVGAEKLWPQCSSVIALTFPIETPCTYISPSAPLRPSRSVGSARTAAPRTAYRGAYGTHSPSVPTRVTRQERHRL